MMISKAWFLVMFTFNGDNSHTPHHIGRLPNCSFAQVIIKQIRKRKKISNKEFGGYLCMSSDNYYDMDTPLHNVRPMQKYGRK